MIILIKKLLFFYTALLVLAFLLFAGPVMADIYMYIDSGGVLHFTNMPTSSDYRLFVKERPGITKYSGLSGKYDPYIKKAATKNDIPFHLLKALIKTESNFNPSAVSSKGAMGLMQLMPETAKLLEVDNPFDPKENIAGGSRYLKSLLDQFDGKLPMALAAYNAGPTIVARLNKIPPFAETQNYVKKVMEYYNLLRKTL